MEAIEDMEGNLLIRPSQRTTPDGYDDQRGDAADAEVAVWSPTRGHGGEGEVDILDVYVHVSVYDDEMLNHHHHHEYCT